MRPLEAKEIRLLKPAWLVALLLAVVPVWVLPGRPYNEPEQASLAPLVFGLVMLSLSAFGREFSLQTFAFQLAQPLERLRVWQAKSGLLAVAMLSVFVAWLVSCAACLRVSTWQHLSLNGDAVTFAIAAAVVAYAGGLWTTLLLRQVAAAFWFTLLIPGGIAVTMDEAKTWQLLAVQGVYAAAGYWWARRLFLRAQETAWTGGEITLPGFRGRQTALGARTYRPLAALLWKEIQMHQVALAGMAGLFLLHLGAVGLRQVHPQHLSQSLRTLIEVFGGVWIVVPLLASSVAVAEERKLGTLAQQLTLPVSRRAQFFLKLVLTLVIGGLLSASLMGLAEMISSAIGAPGSMFDKNMGPADVAAFYSLFLTFSFLGFYASTLSRNLVQALAAAVVSCVVLWVLVVVAPYPDRILRLPIWNGFLIYYFGGPALLVTICVLAWRNFRSESGADHLWRRNALVAGSVLGGVFLLTFLVYNRSWELLTPVDPPAGTAKIAGSGPGVLRSYGGNLAAILPDGRLWVDRLGFEPGRRLLGFNDQTGFQLGYRWTSLSGQQFADGTNWVTAFANFRETVAIRADGTLWLSEKPRRPRDRNREAPQFEGAAGLAQYGSETNWLSAVSERYPWSIVLLKQDGTLWRLGTNVFSEKNPWPGLRSFVPQRLVAESGWDRLLPGVDRLYVWKRDGTAWAIHAPVSGDQNRENEMGVVLDPVPTLDGTKWRSLAVFLEHKVALRADGTLWSWPPDDRYDLHRSGKPYRFPLTRISPDSDWVALSGEYQTLAARKVDGSVWRWGFPGWENRNDPFVQPPVRLGSRNDWVAMACGWGGLFALAADGNLYYWFDRSRVGYGDSDQPMLSPSRKPVLIENILAGK